MKRYRASQLRLGSLAVFFGVVLIGWSWTDEIGWGQVQAATANAPGHLKNADGSWKYTNRLAGETSPYLLLHAHNPVEWYPWGAEALERSLREDKPIFLSVGYSTCYWCHVMERLVFSDEKIAMMMNEWFVNIKVDREERPDLDQIYMNATYLVSGNGGWPNSVFLTPDLKPYFAGTYFPPQDSHGLPGFPRVLKAAHSAWEDRRGEVMEIATRMAAAIRRLEEGGRTLPTVPDTAVVNLALSQIKRFYDARSGGFGGAPKFPPCIRLEFLLSIWERNGDERAGEIVSHTLDAMAQGGIYDQVGGGFHRYSTDARWQIPHFEKMLYNQAYLARLYLRGYQIAGEESWRRIAEEIFAFVGREMTSESGAFHSALDAETEAVEGKYYLWTAGEIEETLAENAELFFEVYDLVPMPDEEGGVTSMKRSLEEAAADMDMESDSLRKEVEVLRGRLLNVRAKRTYPLLDDKVLTAWNGMMIDAYALGYGILQEPAYRRAGETAAEFVLEQLRMPDGGLRRVYRQGMAKYNAYLEDYAFLSQGLLSLYRTTGEERWLKAGGDVVDQMIRRFWDEEKGGFFFAEGGVDLIVRSKNAKDSALPAANAVAVHCLLDLARWTGKEIYMEKARETLYTFGGMMRDRPGSFTHMIAAADKLISGNGSGPDPAVIVGLPLWAVDGLPSTWAGPLEDPVQARVDLSLEKPAAGQNFQVAVHLDISAGWHINAYPASNEMLIPTSLTLNADLPLEIVDIIYPPSEPVFFAALGDTLEVYQDQVVLRAELRMKQEAVNGQKGELRLLVQYQACDEVRCLPPTDWDRIVKLEVAPGEDAGEP